MNGNIFIVYTAKQDGIGLCANARKIHSTTNLVGFCRDSRVQSLNVVRTWKEAQTIADQWNEDYRKNGSQKPVNEWR